MPSVSILLIISIKATRPHEGSLRAERIINPGAEYFLRAGLKLLLPHLLHEQTCTSRRFF